MRPDDGEAALRAARVARGTLTPFTDDDPTLDEEWGYDVQALAPGPDLSDQQVARRTRPQPVVNRGAQALGNCEHRATPFDSGTASLPITGPGGSSSTRCGWTLP